MRFDQLTRRAALIGSGGIAGYGAALVRRAEAQGDPSCTCPVGFIPTCVPEATPSATVTPFPTVTETPVPTATNTPPPTATTAPAGWTMLPTNPTIAAETTAVARTIWAVRPYNGRVYLGYGDWNVNTGPCDLIYWDGAAYYAAISTFATEAIDHLYVVNGELWALPSDPTVGTNPDYARINGTIPTIANLSEPSHVHMFGVCRKASDGSLYLAGSYSGADNNVSIWRSANNGTTWARVRQEPQTAGLRYWSVQDLNGTLWTQRDGTNPKAQFSTDGLTWQAASFQMAPSGGVPPKRMQVFNNTIVFLAAGVAAPGNIVRFDGTKAGSWLAPSGFNSYWDLCVADDGLLYVLQAGTSFGSRIWRTANGTAWDLVGQLADDRLRSFWVENGVIWAGGRDAVFSTAPVGAGV